MEQGAIIRALIGAVVAGAIAAAARRVRMLTESGQWAAFVLGTAACAAGWGWAALLVAFFVSSSALTRWRATQKSQRTDGTLPRGSARNAGQVFANGGLFVIFALATRGSRNEWWAFAALGALAASTSDTWSSEIGTALGGVARSIVTLKEVEHGMSGGVTLAGFAAGAAGALFIALPGAFLIPNHHAALAMSAAGGGFSGCVADSIIGATLQAKRFCDRCSHWTERRVHPCGYRTRHGRGVYWISNDVVNVAGAFSGATIAVLIGTLLMR